MSTTASAARSAWAHDGLLGCACSELHRCAASGSPSACRRHGLGDRRSPAAGSSLALEAQSAWRRAPRSASCPPSRAVSRPAAAVRPEQDHLGAAGRTRARRHRETEVNSTPGRGLRERRSRAARRTGRAAPSPVASWSRSSTRTRWSADTSTPSGVPSVRGHRRPWKLTSRRGLGRATSWSAAVGGGGACDGGRRRIVPLRRARRRTRTSRPLRRAPAASPSSASRPRSRRADEATARSRDPARGQSRVRAARPPSHDGRRPAPPRRRVERTVRPSAIEVAPPGRRAEVTRHVRTSEVDLSSRRRRRLREHAGQPVEGPVQPGLHRAARPARARPRSRPRPGPAGSGRSPPAVRVGEQGQRRAPASARPLAGQRRRGRARRRPPPAAPARCAPRPTVPGPPAGPRPGAGCGSRWPRSAAATAGTASPCGTGPSARVGLDERLLHDVLGLRAGTEQRGGAEPPGHADGAAPRTHRGRPRVPGPGPRL